jgi:hypothetical protein
MDCTLCLFTPWLFTLSLCGELTACQGSAFMVFKLIKRANSTAKLSLITIFSFWFLRVLGTKHNLHVIFTPSIY